MINKPKTLLIAALFSIAVLFGICATATYSIFSDDVTKNELSNQQKMARIVNQSLLRYFETLKVIAENAALNIAFKPENTKNEDQIRFKPVSSTVAKNLGKQNRILGILNTPRTSIAIDKIDNKTVLYWQIFKGIPDAINNNQLTTSRRTIARNILKTFSDIHYAFEMDANGDLVFLEPFETQKNITSFNYEFRDYLRIVKSTRATAISEGYISHDQNRTQIITIATPIFDETGNVAKVFAVSVSANTIRDKVFRFLRENLDLQDGTVFSLLDRHAHIVASSSGKNIYFPIEGNKGDDADRGNLQAVGFFKNVEWTNDVLEKGNIWERNTKSWVHSTLAKDYAGRYINGNDVEVFGTLFPTAIIGSDSKNWGILVETPVETVLATKNKIKLVFILAGLVLLTILLAISYTILKSFFKLESQVASKHIELSKISAQVAHDIRSPLAALDMIATHLSELPEEKRTIVRSAVSRIKDIANNLLSKKDAPVINTETQCEFLSSMIDEIITEKRLQFRSRLGLTIELVNPKVLYGVFLAVPQDSFKRVISNILNNSIEAIPDTGKISISAKVMLKSIEIQIEDNGQGIPRSILPSIVKKGASFGKKNGNGLGLYHASESLKEWGGTLKIASVENEGTIVSLILPQAQSPIWYLESIKCISDQVIAIVDDDNSVHQIWDDRFSELTTILPNLQIKHFSSPNAFSGWYKTSKPQQPLTALVDFEFNGQRINGLDLIANMGIENSSVLVTSHFEEPAIKTRCLQMGVKLLPKGQVGFVPISVGTAVENQSNSKQNQQNSKYGQYIDNTFL